MNECTKKTSGVHVSSHKPTKKCEMKKEKLPHKNFRGERKDFIKSYQKDWLNQFQ